MFLQKHGQKKSAQGLINRQKINYFNQGKMTQFAGCSFLNNDLSRDETV